MFTDYEKFTCETCKNEFYGRRPSEWGKIKCIDCKKREEEPILDLYDDAPIPSEVLKELENGRGDS